VESDRVKEENDNLKKELNEYKEKTKALEEEKKKMNDDMSKMNEDISKLKEEKEKIQTTSDILNKINIINKEIKPGEEINKISIPSGNNTVVNKTVQDMGDGRIVETIEIVTEEEVVSDKDKSNSNSSIQKDANTTPEAQKIVKITEGEPSGSKIITTTTTTTTTEGKPDNEFLKKIRMFSPKVDDKVISKVGGTKKVTIKDSSISADKNKSKEDRMNKAMARIKKKRDKDSEDKEKTSGRNPNDPMFKSARIKDMAALLEQHINENDNTSKPGGPSGIAGGAGIGHEVIVKDTQSTEDAFEHMADMLQGQPGKVMGKRKMTKKKFEEK
jgi:hypothetical protein